MSLPRLPYLQNAVAGFSLVQRSKDPIQTNYIEWMRNQGLIMPVKMDVDIDSVRLEFTDPESETLFALRWA